MNREAALTWAKKFFFNHRVRWHRSNLKLFGECRRILDLGGGKGLFASLAPGRVTCLDGVYESLACQEAGHARIQGRADELPFKDASFDGVYLADVIEHFGPQDARNLIGEAVRILKKGGRLVIATPYPSREFWCDPTHIRPYPPDALLSYFRPDAEKGKGTCPSLPSVTGGMKLEKIHNRRRPLMNLPMSLYEDRNRKYLRNWVRPQSLLYFLSNLLARVGISSPFPEGYVCLLKKESDA